MKVKIIRKLGGKQFQNNDCSRRRINETNTIHYHFFHNVHCEYLLCTAVTILSIVRDQSEVRKIYNMNFKDLNFKTINFTVEHL